MTSRGILALCAIAAVAVAAGCSSGGGDSALLPSTTSSTTTTTATTASYGAAGLLTPPAGVTQAQADAFAEDLIAALDASGWPELDRQSSIGILQTGLDTASITCQLLDTSAELGPEGVAAAARYAAEGQLPDLTAGIEAVGVPADAAGGLARGFLVGAYTAGGQHLCPQHAQVLADATQDL